MAAGQVLGGRCELIDEIGRGRRGTVYRAYDAPLGQVAAAKVLSAGTDGGAFADFFHERRRFAHPNVVAVLDSFQAGDALVVLTDLYEHGTLADLVRRQPEVAAAWAPTIGADLLGALQEMHGQGVVHGDLHAGNVLVAPDGPGLRGAVADFGTARADGRARGSAEVTPPEVWAGAIADERGDLFAVGALLRQCLAGADEAPPAYLAALVADLTAQDPAARPGAAAAALGRIQAGGATAGPAVTLPRFVAPLPDDWSPAGPAPSRLGRLRAVAPALHPFVGRRAELGRLDAAREQLDAGRGGAVVLIGEAGAGKTRLVREWVDRLGEMLVVAGACTVDGSSVEPWQSLVIDVVDALGADAIAARLGDEASVLARFDEQFDRASGSSGEGDLFGAVDAVLRAAAREHPVVAVLEDLHHATPESLAVLAHLAESSDAPVLLVGTARPHDGLADLDGVERFALDELGPADVGRLVSAVTGDDRPELADAAMQRAGGNPFFVVEIAQSLTGDGALPDTVAQAVLQRVDERGSEARPVLEVAALLGTSFTAPPIARVLDLDPGSVADVLDRAAARRLLTRPGAFDDDYRFTHDLVPESLRDAMAPDRRRARHLAIARGLEADVPGSAEELGTLAAHLAAAGGESRAAAREAYELAWRRAGDDGAPEVAIDFGGSALELARELGDIDAARRIGPELGEQCERIGRLARALELYSGAAAEAADPVTEASLVRHHAVALEKAGDYTDSIEQFDRALTVLGSAGPGADRDLESSRATLGLAVTRFFKGDFAESRDLSQRGLELAERLGDDRLIAQACLQLEMVGSELGLSERAGWGRRARELLESLDDPVGLGNLLLNLGVSDYNEGAWEQARADYQAAIVAYDRAHDTIGAGIVRNNEAEILTGQGRMREARWKLVEARDSFRGSGYAMGEALATSGLSRVALHTGRVDEARRLLGRATEMFRDLDAANFVYDSAVREVELALYSTAPDAVDLVDRARKLEREMDEEVAIVPITLLRLEAVAAWLREDREASTRLLVAAEERARAENALSELALVLHAIVAVETRSDDATAAELTALNESLGIVWLPPLPAKVG